MINDMFRRGLGTGWLAVALLLAIGIPAACQDTVNPDEEKKMRQEIVNVLQAQAGCWNRKDIEGFMQSYWKSDQLTFSGGGKTIRGWQATLDRYQEKYPPEKMGQLAFDHLEIIPLSSSTSLVLGQWHVGRRGKIEWKFLARISEARWWLENHPRSFIDCDGRLVEIRTLQRGN